MKFASFVKYWCLAWMAASIGAAAGCVVWKDYLSAIFYVISCAINHFCYRSMVEPSYTEKMKKCRICKCKAACCYNIVLPAGLLEQFADKVVNKVIATSPMPYNPEFPPSVAVETSEKIADNKCPFLRADYKCNIYEHRPLICRKFGDCSHPMLICRYMK